MHAWRHQLAWQRACSSCSCAIALSTVSPRSLFLLKKLVTLPRVFAIVNRSRTSLPMPVLKKSGRLSSRSVCPVGAVSKTTQRNWP